MCLYIKKNYKAKKAWRNITCYKVLRQAKELSFAFTPFRGTKIEKDVLSGERPFSVSAQESEISSILLIDESRSCVEAGSIHTYKRYKDAKFFADWWAYNAVIYKCIIPKGTLYYKGKTGPLDHEVPGYASRQIVFKKKLKYEY